MDSTLAWAALESGPPMYLADLNGTLRFANAGFRETAAALGYRGDRPILDVQMCLDAHLAQKAPLRHEFETPWYPASRVCYGMFEVLTQDGQPIGVKATFAWIDPASEAARTQTHDLIRQRLDDIVRLATNWIWETDRGMRFTYVSPRITDLLGYHPKELTGASWTHIAKAGLPLQVAPEAGHTPAISECDVTLRHRDGSMREAQVSAVPVYQEGVFVGYRGIARDVTQMRAREYALQRAKEQAEQADRTKSLFLAQMSHELRTPLNAIIGFSEIIAAETLGEVGVPAYREYAGDILASARHLLAVINDVLDVSKIESGTFRLAEDEADANELMAEARRLVASQAAQAGVTIRLGLVAGVACLEVDVSRIRQVLVNLLSNAAKFTPEGGSLDLVADWLPDGRFAFRVIDQGPGMTEAQIATALTPFGQVDNTMARRYGGIGLGLPLAERLMTQHGGTLAIESEPGQGTTVSAILPARRVSDLA